MAESKLPTFDEVLSFASFLLFVCIVYRQESYGSIYTLLKSNNHTILQRDLCSFFVPSNLLGFAINSLLGIKHRIEYFGEHFLMLLSPT